MDNAQPSGLSRFFAAPEMQDSTRDLLMAAGSAMGNGGRGFSESLTSSAQKRKKSGKEAALSNLTADWLQAQGASEQFIEMARQGYGARAMQMHQAETKVKAPKPYTDIGQAKSDLDRGLISQEQFEALASGQGANAPKHSMSPLYVEGPNGMEVMQLSNAGGARQVELPEGYKALSPYNKSFQQSQGRNDGKVKSENVESLASAESKMANLEAVVGQLDELADQATYTMVGQGIDSFNRQFGNDPRESSIAREKYIAMIDNQVLPLLRETFGAAFTQKEGESLKATLGNPDLHPTEKKAVLRAFIEQKKRNVQDMQNRNGVPLSPAPQPTQPMPAGKTSAGVSWSIK